MEWLTTINKGFKKPYFSGKENVYTRAEADELSMYNDNLDILDAALIETAWIPVTFLNSWTNLSGGDPAAYKQIGKVVYIKGQVVPVTAGTAIFTLPAGLRPPITRRFAIYAGAAGIVLCSVDNNGNVIPAAAAIAVADINITFALD